MYSLILMSTLTAAPEGPEFNGFFRRLFSFGAEPSASQSAGCYGSCTSQSMGCTGSSCHGSSCQGSSCHGSSCQGSSSSTGFGHRLRAFGNRNNSCYGSGTSRSGGCTGTASAKAGCCGGGCTGSYSYGCTGSFGPTYGPPPPLPPEGFASPSPAVSYTAPVVIGGCGGGGIPLGVPAPVYGPSAMPAPSPMLPTAPMPPAADGPQATPRPAAPPPPPTVEENRGGTTGLIRTAAGPGRATVVVRLPADAELFADGRKLTLTSAERSFVTPPLPPGAGFTYTFRAEYVRNGESITQTKRVSVSAGGTATVEFTDLTMARTRAPRTEVAAVAASASEPNPLPSATSFARPPASPPTTSEPREPARITVKLPPGTTLYVDDRHAASEGQREFTTPPLPPGQDFAYLMKAERTRNGQPEFQVQKVTFRAGELVTVDFGDWPTR